MSITELGGRLKEKKKKNGMGSIACIYFSKIYTMSTGNITERIDADEEKYLEKVNL